MADYNGTSTNAELPIFEKILERYERPPLVIKLTGQIYPRETIIQK